MLPAMYLSSPGIIIAGGCLTHTRSQQGHAGFWNSPLGSCGTAACGWAVVAERNLSSPILYRVKVDCSPYRTWLWECAFLIFISELLGRSCLWVNAHPHLYPDPICCLWFLPQESHKAWETLSLIKPHHFPLGPSPRLKELASLVE